MYFFKNNEKSTSGSRPPINKLCVQTEKLKKKILASHARDSQKSGKVKYKKTKKLENQHK